jgi:hypothetical protein
VDIFVIIFASLILLDIAAYLFGADSRESWNSPEWERRREWKGFGGSGD